MKIPKLKYAVGSVAQKAAEGADSLLSEARKDVVAARKPEPVVAKEEGEMAEAVAKVKAAPNTTPEKIVQENISDANQLINDLKFAGGNKKLNKQFVKESLVEVSDSTVVKDKQSIAEFITDLHRTQMEEEKSPLLAPEDFKKLTAFAEERTPKNEGGELVDTYDNIPDSEKAKVKASQKPDAVMEEEYAEHVIDKALSEEEQEILIMALEGNEKLGNIFDKVMAVAGEFAGSGAVEADGIGTGTSDSIPARLSEGEFVFTKKAVDHIGKEKLQVMMDEAEQAFDNTATKKAEGGILEKESNPVYNQMLSSNAMPSVN